MKIVFWTMRDGKRNETAMTLDAAQNFMRALAVSQSLGDVRSFGSRAV